MMYTLTLTGEQVAAVRLAIKAEINAREQAPRMSDRFSDAALREADTAIAEQWFAQHVAQRDAALRED